MEKKETKITLSKLVKDIKDAYMAELKDGYSSYNFKLSDYLRREPTRQECDMLAEAAAKLRAVRGVEDCKVRGAEYDHWLNSWYCWDAGILVWAKPCKEFLQLNKWLAAHGCKQLKPNDVRHDSLFGKRDDTEVTGTRWLAHNGTKCARILDYLKKNSRARKVKVSVTNDTYYGDRFNSYGEDMEGEWSGYKDYLLKVDILTPTGREVSSMEFYAY